MFREARTIPLAGQIAVAADGSFTLTLKGGSGVIPPIEPPTEIPPDAIVLEPSGSDDTQRLQDAVDNLQEGATLLLKGMFRVSDTIKLEGGRRRTVAGYPGVRSGILVESADMPGLYGSMLWFKNAVGSTMRDLEIDGQGRSTMPLCVDGGEDNTIENCWVHDIGYSDNSDPTLAAIHSEGGTRLRVIKNRIERTGGRSDIDSGIRGIWLGKGQADVLVEDNEVSDTGHTGIAVEPCSGVIRRNRVFNAVTNGTGYKIMLHPQGEYVGEVEFYDNSVEDTCNAGLMLEGAAYESCDVHHNVFRNCGKQGTSFGALYTSQWTTSNLCFRDNAIENCRSQGAMNRSERCLIENNQISGESTLWLENDCSQITINNSGLVSVGNNCSQITVDGQVIA